MLFLVGFSEFDYKGCSMIKKIYFDKSDDIAVIHLERQLGKKFGYLGILSYLHENYWENYDILTQNK